MADGGRKLGATPWQTVGPFFHYALPWPGGADLAGGEGDLGARPELAPSEHFLLQSVSRSAPGEAIWLEGRVLDGAGEAVPDALIEIWQADGEGRYDSPGFAGLGRAATADDGTYAIHTVRPGRTPGPGNTLQAPHIAIGVLGRGLFKRLVTRAYLEDGEGLETDPVLDLVPAPRRQTLLARAIGPGRYSFDIVLQGDAETVFFEF